jgi:predicted RNase H-like nuclease (RuvC/YqgF family)
MSLLALSLTLFLGQTPAQAPTLEELERTAREAEVKQLRAQIELLQAELEAQQSQQQQDQERLQSLEQQDATESARAQLLEQFRQQRVESLRSGFQWMLTVDQLLERGDLSVGPALTSARQDISTALASAAETGRGDTSRLLESALDRLVIAEEAVEQRDVYRARLELQTAGFELREAWRHSLQRSGATLVNQ